MFEILKTKRTDYIFDRLVLLNLAMYIFAMQFRETRFMSLYMLRFITLRSIRVSFAIVILKCIYDFLRGKFSLKEIIMFSLFGIYFTFIYLKDGEAVPLLIVLYMAALKGISYDRIVKYSFYSLTICFLIIVLSSLTPLSNDIVEEFSRNGGIIFRHTLGYGQHGYAPNYYLSVVIMYLLYRKEFKYIEILVLLVIDIIIYRLVFTRNSFACVLILLAMCLVFKVFKDNKLFNITSITTAISFPLGTIVALVLTYLYKINNQFAIKLNSMLTGRISLMASGIDRWGIRLFGQRTNMYSSTEYVYIDSAYVNVLVNLGIVTLLIVIAFYIYYTYLVNKSKNVALLIVLFVTSVHSVFDPQLTLLNYSPFILLFISLLYKCFKVKV